MDLSKYEELTGITVPASQQTLVTAQIRRTQNILEDLLGFTLDPDKYDDNKYVESGKTQTECPCPDDSLTLDDPDSIVFAYRLYPYFKHDKFLLIDPASTIHKVKLVKDTVTYKTFDTDEFRTVQDRDIIKYLELCATECCCLSTCTNICKCVQLAVDATWLWSDGNIPTDLLDVWAEMTTYYADSKKGLKSETLGPHSYTKWDDTRPEDEKHNASVIAKYAGPLGSSKRTLTV